MSGPILDIASENLNQRAFLYLLNDISVGGQSREQAVRHPELRFKPPQRRWSVYG
jgi:hypothetical protein